MFIDAHYLFVNGKLFLTRQDQIDTSSNPTLAPSRKEKLKYNKKQGVELMMKFRNHKDPLYYDADANDKIFVPSIMVTRSTLTRLQEEDLTEEQKKILLSLPEKDRGIFNSEDMPQQIPGLQVLDDPIEAAALKAKIKQKKMRQAHK